MFRDAVRKFLMDEAYEQHAEWEKEGQIDRNFWYKAGEQGMLCPVFPRSTAVWADFRYNMVIAEEVSRLGLTGIGFRYTTTLQHPT